MLLHSQRTYGNSHYCQTYHPLLSMNSIPNDKILDWLKLRAFADGKISVTKKLIFVMGRVENILGKEETAGNQHFLLFL